jgi:hypothetical protein
MSRETVPPWERRQVNYDRVAMEYDGDDHQLVERTENGYEAVDE